MPEDRPLPAALNPRSAFSLAVTVVGLAGVPAFFLPFAYGTSPQAAVTAMFSSDTILNRLWHFGVPLLLALLVTAATIRRVISGRFTRAEGLAAYGAALVGACCVLSTFFLYWGDSGGGPSSFLERFMMAFLWMGSAEGAYLLRRNARAGVPTAANAIAAMQVIYVVVALYLLVGFGSDGWQIGAYLVAVTTLVYAAQVIAISVAAPGHALPTHR